MLPGILDFRVRVASEGMEVASKMSALIRKRCVPPLGIGIGVGVGVGSGLGFGLGKMGAKGKMTNRGIQENRARGPSLHGAEVVGHELCAQVWVCSNRTVCHAMCKRDTAGASHQHACTAIVKQEVVPW